MAMSTGGGRGPRAPLGEINVTPFVDVMLVLLIIFMVAAPMMATSVPIDLPQAQADRMQADPDRLLLSIDARRQILLGTTPVPFDELEARLRANPRVHEQGELYVQADRAVPYGFVVQVFALIRQAGIARVGLVTDPGSTTATPEQTSERGAGHQAR